MTEALQRVQRRVAARTVTPCLQLRTLLEEEGVHVASLSELRSEVAQHGQLFHIVNQGENRWCDHHLPH